MAVIGVSLLIVAAVTVAVVVGVTSGEKSGDVTNSVLRFSEMIDSLCAVTDHKKTCVDTLSQEAEYSKATPIDYIKIIISRLRQEVQSVAAIKDTFAKVVLVPSQIAALQDCQDLLKSADDNLASSLRMVSAGLQSLIDHEDSLKSQLSAVISYQQTCKDGIKRPSIRAAIRLRLQTVTELTSDALALITQIPDINNILGAPDAGNPRKLLGLAEARDGGYPTWFSATDRGLSELHGKGPLKPNVVVAKDGSGQYRTISEAVVAYSENRNHRGTYVIYVKSGMYEENITLKLRWGTVSMYGDGPRKTIITGRKNCHDQFTALRTATFSVRGKGFIARSMAFRNTAGPEGGQAVALQVQADMSAFFNCRIDGYEGTLHALARRQFYRDCYFRHGRLHLWRFQHSNPKLRDHGQEAT
ncbi:probable pectinesterase/pectinesterase inhibitor 21 isoform X2 [Vitis riparia]|uniref:probable pectinesterase/pectinesterase inhibitor 21 isoform X2 n=1 Tax=Vitis riparia TaxID=96939 RepID=UPI00155A50B6|nr:probable pectinesterase/pectinesterase inhibitor 21 isoform X2 [Vitis riparia]